MSVIYFTNYGLNGQIAKKNILSQLCDMQASRLKPNSVSQPAVKSLKPAECDIRQWLGSSASIKSEQ